MRGMRKMPTVTAALFLTLAVTSCGSGVDSSGTSTRPSTTDDPPVQDATKTPKGTSGDPSPTLPPANPAPDFSVETFEGETFSLAEQRGTPVVLNFWESW